MSRAFWITCVVMIVMLFVALSIRSCERQGEVSLVRSDVLQLMCAAGDVLDRNRDASMEEVLAGIAQEFEDRDFSDGTTLVDGYPVDPWGTRYEFSWITKDGFFIVACRSLGRDCERFTLDDIVLSLELD